MSFDDKLKTVLKEVSSKNFIETFPKKSRHLFNLKKFRDLIVHTKAKSDGDTPFDYLYKEALEFKYEETLLAVRDFMNYYESNYIEECNCGEDW